MDDQHIKSSITNLLESYGFSVKPIKSKNNKKSADLLAEKHEEKYFIEIKTRQD